MTLSAIAITILLLSGAYLIVRRKQLEQSFIKRVGMTVDYMFQERPGQYSGDRNVKSGVFVFKAERNDDKLKNIVIRKVRPLHSALDVNLEQILVIPFEQKDTSNQDVSVRFKVVKKGTKLEDLRGKKISISGVMNFEKNKPEPFKATLLIKGLYENLRV